MPLAARFSAHTKLLLLGVAACIGIVFSIASAHAVFALTYGAGTYGTCTYGTCSITLTTSSNISVNVTPAAGATRCTVASDSVTATTDSSTGYTVTMTDTDTTNTLNGTGATIPASSATPSAPAVLTANTWGYRVDSVASFGAGPTSAVTNAAVPTVTFAGVPLSSGTAAAIRTTSTKDSSTVSTPVWYGICVNSSLKSGAYTDGVTYTAVIN